MRVAHDPGHGAEPRLLGCEHNGIVERELVLSIATDIAAGIPWVQHLLLRSELDGPPYRDRAAAALAADVRLVLCHHANAYSDATARGLLAFYAPGDDLGLAVADVIQRSAPAPLWQHRPHAIAAHHGDWTADARGVLEPYRRAGIAAVLIEWGYTTSPDDAAALRSLAVRPALVACAAAGIARAFELSH